MTAVKQYYIRVSIHFLVLYSFTVCLSRLSNTYVILRYSFYTLLIINISYVSSFLCAVFCHADCFMRAYFSLMVLLCLDLCHSSTFYYKLYSLAK